VGDDLMLAPEIAIDADGNGFVTGSFSGALDLGGGPLSGQQDLFLMKIDASGTPLWSRSFGDATAAQGSTSIAVNDRGEAIVSGYFMGTIDFGGGALTAETGKWEIFLVKLYSDGSHHWSGDYGGSLGERQPTDIATDSTDSILMTGPFRESFDLGGDSLVSAGLNDAFVAKFGP
jgi:hypothetical protein